MPRFGRASVIALAAALACPACKGGGSADVDAGGARPAGSIQGLTPQQSAEVLARVGDRTITVGDYVAAFEHMDQFDRLRYGAPERRKELLHEMIDVMVLADEAREKGYDKDPATEQEIREILRDAFLEQAREGSPTPGEIPEAEARAYYDAHKGDFHDPERRRVSAIVLPTERAAAAILETARQSTATEWGELVRQKSIDPLARANVPVDLAGDQGFVAAPGDDRGANPRVPDEVRAAVFEIGAVGEVLPRVVKAARKFYLVRYASKSDARDRSFTDAERSVRVKLAQDKLRARQDAIIEGLRAQFLVTIDESALAEVRVQVTDAGGGD